jgi:hypothetical protein
MQIMFIIIIIIIYYPFSPHNGITIAVVLILLFSPVKDKSDLSWNYYYYYY